MGLFDFVAGIASAGVKIAATPIVAAGDVVSVVTGGEPEATEKLIKSAGNSLTDAVDKIMP